MNFLLKINVEKDRRLNLVILDKTLNEMLLNKFFITKVQHEHTRSKDLFKVRRTTVSEDIS